MSEWVCADCGVKCELGIEELYLEALIKEGKLEIVSVRCPLCGLNHEPSPFTYEEGLKLLKVMVDRQKEND